MWKAFDEMQQLGWIGPSDRGWWLVQAEGCAPIVRAFERGAEHAELFPNAATVAAGLRVPAAVGDFMMLRAVRESGGTALTITDDELLAGVASCRGIRESMPAPKEGPSGRRLSDSSPAGWLKPHEEIVLFNTGSGLKYNHLFPVGNLPSSITPTRTACRA